LKRVKSEYDDLLREQEEDQLQCKVLEEKTQQMLIQQANEIKRLTSRSLEPFSAE
jgi:hypothetical protein